MGTASKRSEKGPPPGIRHPANPKDRPNPLVAILDDPLFRKASRRSDALLAPGRNGLDRPPRTIPSFELAARIGGASVNATGCADFVVRKGRNH